MKTKFDDCWLSKWNENQSCPSEPSKTAELELKDFLGTESFKVLVNGIGDDFTITKNSNEYIIAGGEIGVLYGAYRLKALLNSGVVTDGFTLTEKPAFKHRIINHWDNMDGSVERGYAGHSIFFENNKIAYSRPRITHYARLLASVGINALSINNVNVHKEAVSLITEEKLKELKELASIFRSFGIKLILSINFASPMVLNELDTADPRDEKVKQWWKNRMNLIYSYIPDLLAIVVKADSEGQPGPFTYGADHADGANLLADAIAPHGGLVFWRCFVYNCKQDWRDTVTDRPKSAYDTYKPLDGQFRENVILQIKFGPFDFQVREPVTPLFGAMPATKQALELQLAQEYTGHQIDLYYLATQWKEIFDFNTHLSANGTIAAMAGNTILSIAAVSNIGDDQNWTGHALAAANLYAYGRMGFNPNTPPGDIAAEWCNLMFDKEIQNTIQDMLMTSREIYESYTTPMGLCWMVTPHGHYGPDPLGYEFSLWGTYHRADRNAIGIDRSKNGTGYSEQYAPPNASLYGDITTCPENLLLFFHRVRYDHILRNSKTLAQSMYDAHFNGLEGAENFLKTWKTLSGKLPQAIYENVLERLTNQTKNAKEWCDIFNTFIYRLSGIKDEQNRNIHP